MEPLAQDARLLSRCYSPLPSRPVQLVGFCDASVKAYAAAVYLRFGNGDKVCTRFVAARTRVPIAESFTMV